MWTQHLDDRADVANLAIVAEAPSSASICSATTCPILLASSGM